MFIISNDIFNYAQCNNDKHSQSNTQFKSSDATLRTWHQLCGHTLTHATTQAHALGFRFVCEGSSDPHANHMHSFSQVEEPISNLHAKVF